MSQMQDLDVLIILSDLLYIDRLKERTGSFEAVLKSVVAVRVTNCSRGPGWTPFSLNSMC